MCAPQVPARVRQSLAAVRRPGYTADSGGGDHHRVHPQGDQRLDLMLVAALVVWAFRAYPKRHRVRLGAALSATFLVTEALLGAALVLLNHVAAMLRRRARGRYRRTSINTLILLAASP